VIHALRSTRGRIAIALGALAILTVVIGVAVYSGFSSTKASAPSKITAGTVVLATDGTGAELFEIPAMAPGESSEKCVEVTYSGTLKAKVQMYGEESGALAGYLQTKVIRGAFPGAAPADNACTGFTPDGDGGSLFSGLLNTFPTESTPITDPLTSWEIGSHHVYKVLVELPTGVPNAAQGAEGSATFNWQAENN
jgi:hypothetical protein